MPFTNQQIFTENLPSYAEVELQSIDKGYIKILLGRLLLKYGILIALVIVTLNVPILTKAADVSYELNLLIYILIALALFQITLTTLGFKKRKFALRTHDVIYSFGLLTNSITLLPYSKVQHIELKRSFLHRKFKLADLYIYSAGTSSSDLKIKGLSFNDAKKIHAFLTTKLNA